MRTMILSLLLYCPWLGLQAFTNFVQNPYTPYPEGCEAVAGWYEVSSQTKQLKFHEGNITLKQPGAQGWPGTAVIKAYRLACAESNRSKILLQFTTPNDSGDYFYNTPTIRAVFEDGRSVLMSLSEAPGTWNLAAWPASRHTTFGMNNCKGNVDFCSTVGWTFVLDNRSPLMPGVEGSEFLTADQYNANFRLELNWSGNSDGYIINVPATSAEFNEAPGIPLSGRLSGLWVIDSTSDQGFNIAISELADQDNGWLYQPPYLPPLLLFLSWYTFDSAGQRMWLTGAAEFEYGAREVEFSLISVSGGEFMGDRNAERQVVGEVKITAHSCNNLGFEYDLSTIGLGAGTSHLNRIFSLELAGHTCRDLGARIAANR